MESALDVHRFHFAFTVTYHYLFPQLTMGLALLIFLLKSLALRTGKGQYDAAARFWAKIFGINFVFGVVTGIPMEFQFGTNWSEFSRLSGGVIGQTLAMEGVFAFFLESAFLGLFLYGQERLSPVLHWVSSLAVFVGSWLSGWFIVATNAWMQHPVGHSLQADGTLQLSSLSALLGNPWLRWQYPHTMLGAVLTAAAAVGATGAYYLLAGRHAEQARLYLKMGAITGLAGAVLIAFPTGDQQGKNVALHQPPTLAAIEGLFTTEAGAPLVFIGQPDVEAQALDNELSMPKMLSFLTWNRWNAEVRGLDEFPRDQWPDNIPLLYYAYRIMVGLGTIMAAVWLLAVLLLRKGRLFRSKAMLWILLLMMPFPYIANTAGWMTAELGRQPWAIYGLLRTAHGSSPTVSAGNAMFTLLGFMGIYVLLSILFLLLIKRELDHGPPPAKGEA